MTAQSLREAAIRQVPLFASLPESEVQRLAASLRVLESGNGAVLLHEGASDDHFLIVVEGQVRVIKALGTTDERELGTSGPGSFLGEMSLFTNGGSHTASVLAGDTCTLLEMRRADFDALLHRQPTLVYELLGMVSNRLDQSENVTILDLREKNRQLTLAYGELQAAQAQLIEKERLEREMQIARDMQLSLLPHDLPTLRAYQLGALMIPAQAVGGDFYDVIPLSRQRLAVVVGDVCGKGVSAALFGTLAYSATRSEARRHQSPGDVLRAVNRHLVSVNSAGTFVTLLYGVLDGASGEFRYARAGHPLPIVLDGLRQPIELPSSQGQMLGLFDNPLLDEQRITIPPDGLALLYSDGLSEAANASGECLSLTPLLSTLAETGATDAQALCDGLWQAVQAHCGHIPQQDDFTVVTIRGARNAQVR